jgi:hypothetical protein
MGTVSYAQDVTLSWDESPSSSVAGYYIYYQEDDDTIPLTGTGADQGDSGFSVGNSLTTEVTGLSDGADYYFTVTAYDDDGNESSYSNIVTTSSDSETVAPVLLFPNDNATDEPVFTSFEWEALDSSYDVYYKLVYGTDETEVAEAGQIPVYPSTPMGPTTGIWFLVAICGIMTLYARRKLNSVGGWAMLALFSFTLLNACGSGGSDSSSSSSSAVSVTSSEDAVLTIVETGSDDFYVVDDLAYFTTYYWKVIAIDNSDATIFYESDIYQCTTLTQ